MNLGIHQADVLQSHGVHPIRNVGDAESVEQLEEAGIVLLRVHGRREKALSGTQIPNRIIRGRGGCLLRRTKTGRCEDQNQTGKRP